MKGIPEVIAYLNQLLAGELAARDQYFIHSRMYHEWGYDKLYERINHEMDDETQHASALIQRIQFLGGVAHVDKRQPMSVGQTVPDMLKADLALEYHVVGELKKAIAACELARDYVSRDMLLVQLEDTEMDHAYYLEKQLRLIDLVGLQNYQQSQIGSATPA